MAYFNNLTSVCSREGLRDHTSSSQVLEMPFWGALVLPGPITTGISIVSSTKAQLSHLPEDPAIGLLESSNLGIDKGADVVSVCIAKTRHGS